jgi:hypothetical protein
MRVLIVGETGTIDFMKLFEDGQSRPGAAGELSVTCSEPAKLGIAQVSDRVWSWEALEAGYASLEGTLAIANGPSWYAAVNVVVKAAPGLAAPNHVGNFLRLTRDGDYP